MRTKRSFRWKDRFSLAIDAIDPIPRFRETGSNVREALINEQIKCKNYLPAQPSVKFKALSAATVVNSALKEAPEDG